MGEVVLRKIQAATEATRGTALAATRKVYGTIQPTRVQPSVFAVEDRGFFADKPRQGNRMLVDAGFSINADATFEDTPWYASLYHNGGISQVGSALLGYSWSSALDETTDSIKTACIECGDDSVQWQGVFGTVDQADYTMALDATLKIKLTGWVADWVPTTSSFLTTSFAGFTGGVAEHNVESGSGWLTRLFIDNAAGTIGTTWITGRLRSATWSVHNQNKRKWFGDSGTAFTRLGRGRRQTSAKIVFEALDTNQFSQYVNNPLLEQQVRIAQFGGPITGSSIGTTSSSIAAGTITSIPVTALASAVSGGRGIYVGGVLFVVAPAGAAGSATSIPVISQTLGFTIPTSSAVTAAKTMLFDWWGDWNTFEYGQVETNVTFSMELQAVYDTTQATEHKLTVINGNSLI